MSFCNAKLVGGFQLIAEVTDLERRIARSTLVITGEGRVDGQTLFGKGPAGVAAMARRHQPGFGRSPGTGRRFTRVKSPGVTPGLQADLSGAITAASGEPFICAHTALQGGGCIHQGYSLLGRDGRRYFAKLNRKLASPQWKFDDATFDRSAKAFENKDHVAFWKGVSVETD